MAVTFTPLYIYLCRFQSNINEIRENTAGHSHVDTATIRETLEMQSEDFRKDGLVSINDESACDKKEEDVPEKVTSGKKLKLSDIFHNIENAMGKVLERSKGA